MTTVPRRSSPLVTIGRLMVVGGLTVFGLLFITAFPVCPMSVPAQSPFPPGCVPGGPPFLSTWDGLLVTPWARRGYTLVLVGAVFFYIGSWVENTAIHGEESP